MAIEKVLLTKEQAEIVERLKENEADLDFILETKIYGKELHGKNGKLFELTAVEIATAFLVGYKIKITPEDRIKEFYEKHKKTRHHDRSYEYSNGACVATRVILDYLGLEIEGVNK